jgi:hypothetical protein
MHLMIRQTMGYYKPRESGILARARNALLSPSPSKILSDTNPIGKLANYMVCSSNSRRNITKPMRDVYRTRIGCLKRLLFSTLGLWWNLETLFSRV